MSILLNLKRKAKALGVCDEYIKRWDECQSKEDLISIALEEKSIDFILDGITFNWGITSKFIKEMFPEFINGFYLYDSNNGYSSELFCRHKGEVIAKSKVIVVIDSSLLIIIPMGMDVTIYAAGRSYLRIRDYGKYNIIAYGSRVTMHRVVKRNISKKVLTSRWIK